MRITGGKAARRILKVPKGLDVRPTPDLVKQAVFNSLGGRVVGRAGAGTVRRHGGAQPRMPQPRRGLGGVRGEIVAPRGGAAPEFSGRPAFRPQTLQVRVQDVFAALAQLAAAGERFDLILADPPYGEKNVGRRSTSFAQQLLDEARLPELLAADGLLVLGHTKRDTLSVPDVLAGEEAAQARRQHHAVSEPRRAARRRRGRRNLKV